MDIFTKEVLKQLVLMTPNSKWLQQGVGRGLHAVWATDCRETHGGADAAKQPWSFNMKKAQRKSVVFWGTLILRQEAKGQHLPISKENPLGTIVIV